MVGRAARDHERAGAEPDAGGEHDHMAQPHAPTFSPPHAARIRAYPCGWTGRPPMCAAQRRRSFGLNRARRATMRPNTARAVLAATLAAIAVAGCGGSDKAGGVRKPEATVLTL